MSACTCDSCIAACKKRPGWFAPGGAERAAKLLGMKFDAFRDEYLIRDYWVGGAYVYSPRKVNQPTGFETAGYDDVMYDAHCVFLKDDRCTIHGAKPMECAVVVACDSAQENDVRSGVHDLWVEAGAPLGEEDCVGPTDGLGLWLLGCWDVGRASDVQPD